MANTVYQPHKSSIGDVDANYIAVACYGAAVIFSYIPIIKYVAWLAPLLIYFLEKKSVLVKFHAVQALILNAIGTVIYILLNVVGLIVEKVSMPKTPSYDYNLFNYQEILDASTKYAKDYKFATITVPSLFFWLAIIFAIVLMALEILAALNAYKYTEYKIPIIGGIAGKVAEKLDKVDFSSVTNPTPPAQPPYTPNQTYTPPAQPYSPPPAQSYTPPAAPKFDTETGQPIAPPPAPPAAQKFDTQTGLPINPPAKPEDPNNSNT